MSFTRPHRHSPSSKPLLSVLLWYTSPIIWNVSQPRRCCHRVRQDVMSRCLGRRHCSVCVWGPGLTRRRCVDWVSECQQIAVDTSTIGLSVRLASRHIAHGLPSDRTLMRFAMFAWQSQRPSRFTASVIQLT